MANPERPRYVLVMRHGLAEQADPMSSLGLTADGIRDINRVGRRLAETLAELKALECTDHDAFVIDVGGILQPDSPSPACDTAVEVRRWLPNAPLPCGESVLDAGRASPLGGRDPTSDVKDARETIERQLAALRHADRKSNAVLVVGHLPLLALLAQSLLSFDRREGIRLGTIRSLPAILPWRKIAPLIHGEIACIRGDFDGSNLGRCHLLWTISPKGDIASSGLREKITAKMNVASFFTATMSALLVFALTMLAEIGDGGRTPAHGHLGFGIASCVALSASLGLYLSTVLFLDRLLMPERFWGETSEANLRKRPSWLVWRPPGSAAGVVYQNMLRIWTAFFGLATVIAGIGLVLLALFLIRQGIVVVLILAVVSVVLLAYAWVLRPRVAVED